MQWAAAAHVSSFCLQSLHMTKLLVALVQVGAEGDGQRV